MMKPAKNSPDSGLTTGDNVAFRDLNKNGGLDPYEDPRRPIRERIEDLLTRMTLEEKAGMMFHTWIDVNDKDFFTGV